MSRREEKKVPGEHRFLLAVDGSESSERAVRYAAGLLGALPGITVTLLHVLAVPQEDLFAGEEERAAWLARHEGEARDFLAGYRRILTDSGLPEEKVGERVHSRTDGIVADVILDEHRTLGACTIVLGRGGKSRKEEFLFGSVSNRIVHQAQGCAVWVVE